VVSPRTLWINRLLMRLSDAVSRSEAEEVEVNPDVSVWVHRPKDNNGPYPALLWLHGGGMVAGTARQDDSFCRRIATELGMVVASVEYRLAPEHPFPTPLEDCHAALRWLARQPDVDSERIAVGGASAGSGLAAALCLMARERETMSPAFQLLVYPMLDDRTAWRTDVDEPYFRIWNAASNRFGWRAYLGEPNPDDVSPLAAPARADDLSGLPPAWIGVGTNDLFHDEDVTYARRLQQAGVRCTLEVVPGAYHGFDQIESYAPVSRTFIEAQISALADALDVPR
jgi:acetyl esterase/lipase